MNADGHPYSRFQVLSQGTPAWALDHKNVPYYFDGFRFWQLADTGRRAPVTSWQCPRHGWVHSPDCVCSLCSPDARADSRAA
jgi:hypothetical protein